MAESTSGGWQVFDPATPVATYTYSFGPGVANALAVGGAGGLIVVSPPCRVGDDVLDAAARLAPVRALVASNAFHHMGIPRWKARFPQAQVFAPTQSIGRVQRKTGISGVRPLSDARDIAGEHVALVDMPHYRTGEVLVRIRTDRGLVWYVTDLLLNLTELPGNPIVRFMFRASGSAPGLRFNKIAPIFMVSDRKALRRWLCSEIERAPPRWLIPAHGDVEDLGADAGPLRRLLAELMVEEEACAGWNRL